MPTPDQATLEAHAQRLQQIALDLEELAFHIQTPTRLDQVAYLLHDQANQIIFIARHISKRSGPNPP